MTNTLPLIHFERMDFSEQYSMSHLQQQRNQQSFFISRLSLRHRMDNRSEVQEIAF